MIHVLVLRVGVIEVQVVEKKVSLGGGGGGRWKSWKGVSGGGAMEELKKGIGGAMEELKKGILGAGGQWKKL